MKVKPTLICLLAGFLLALGSLVFFNSKQRISANESLITHQTIKNFSLVIDSGQGEQKKTQWQSQEKATAFDLLKEGSQKLNLSLEAKSYDIGILIESIDGKKNGQDGKYWFYYVNKQIASVAADKQELQSGDIVEFKFEKSSF